MRKIQVVSLLLLAIASTLAAGFPKFSKDDFSNPTGESVFSIVRSIELEDFSVSSVRYLPDGQRVIVGSSDGRVALVDLASARALWAVSPIANFRDWISVLDVDPTGQKFVFIVSSDQGDAYMTLYIASTQDGRILKKISGEKSNLYQKHFDYEIDLRYPGPDGEKKRLEEDNLAAYWLMVPYAARFTSKGGLITSWKNSADTHAMYDRSFRLFDSNFRRVWDYQVKADEKTWDPLEPAGFKNGLPVPPIVEMTDGSFLFGTPHARVQQLTDALAKSNMKKPNPVDQAFAPVFAIQKAFILNLKILQCPCQILQWEQTEKFTFLQEMAVKDRSMLLMEKPDERFFIRMNLTHRMCRSARMESFSQPVTSQALDHAFIS